MSEMTLNYRMTVGRYPNPNEGVGGLIPGCEIFSLLVGKTKRPQQGSQYTPPYTKRILEQGRTNRLKFASDCPTLHIIIIIIMASYPTENPRLNNNFKEKKKTHRSTVCVVLSSLWRDPNVPHAFPMSSQGVTDRQGELACQDEPAKPDELP